MDSAIRGLERSAVFDRQDPIDTHGSQGGKSKLSPRVQATAFKGKAPLLTRATGENCVPGTVRVPFGSMMLCN